MLPKIEEFMIFKDSNNDTGVIIKPKNKFDWQQCFKDGRSQFFDEGDIYHKNIIKLYKPRFSDSHGKLESLQYMNNSRIPNLELVYDKIEEQNNLITIEFDKLIEALKLCLGKDINIVTNQSLKFY